MKERHVLDKNSVNLILKTIKNIETSFLKLLPFVKFC